jgi:hypothetical protein
MAVAKDRILEKGKLRPGRVGHDRLQKQEARYSVENEVKRWFCMQGAPDLYKLEFREKTYHSRVTGRDALMLLPEKIEFSGRKTKRLHLDLQPLTFTRHHQSVLIRKHLQEMAETSRECVVWARDQIARVVDDHFRRKVPHVGEEDILRVSGALNVLGIQLDAYRRKGYDCFESEFCGFRGMAVTIPKSSRSAFRNEGGHDSGMKPVTDSDFNPVTLGYLSEP